MDTLLSLYPYLLPLAIVPISLTLFFLLQKHNSSTTKNVPPGSTGWPVIGETIRMALSGPQKFIQDRMKKHSPDVFRTSLMGEKIAVFCGAQGNKFVFNNQNTLLVSWMPKSMTAMFSSEYTDNSLDKILSLQRSLIIDLLKPEALRQYVPIMDAMAREHVESEWATRKIVKVYPMLKKYTFVLACRIFVSKVDPEHVETMAKHFRLVVSGMMSFPINLPGTAYYHAIKGGQLVRAELMKIITERRKAMNEKNETEGHDLLTSMLLETDENGDVMSDLEMVNKLTALLLGSYDTTSTTTAFVLKYLAELPDIYNEVLKEQMEIAKCKQPGELLRWEDIQKMKYTWNVVCETLRLSTPGQGNFREAITDFTYAGFTIPKGWKIFWNIFTTHKNSEYFPDPEKFDPSRFEGHGPPPYTFVPFGGGPRMCPGREYARLQILVYIHNVVTKFKWEKVNPQEKTIYRAGPVPKEGLPLRLVPHQQ